MTIEKSVLVPLSAADTFALLTEPERLRRWQVVTARIELQAGGDFRWTITPGHTAAGRVEEVEPGRRLVLSWGWEEGLDPAPGGSTVTITFEPSAGGTLVRLRHTGLTDEAERGHEMGWTHYVERLVKTASGVDTVDEWAGPPDPVDELSAAEASLAVCQWAMLAVGAATEKLPTPCAKFTVADLVDHLSESLTRLGALAGAESLPASEGQSAEDRIATLGQRATEAWRKRGIGGEVPFAGATMPARFAASILSIELLVHAWDVASATGSELLAPEALASFVLERAQEVVQPALRDGDRFADAIVPAPDADAVARLVAFTGRS